MNPKEAPKGYYAEDGEGFCRGCAFFVGYGPTGCSRGKRATPCLAEHRKDGCEVIFKKGKAPGSREPKSNPVYFSAADYCILSAALRHAEESPVSMADVEARANKMLGNMGPLRPLTAKALDAVNQVLWQHHDNNPKRTA